MRDASGLEALLERYDLILNNNPGEATRPTRRNTTPIFDLTFTTLEVGALDAWIIDKELFMPSDHKVMVYDIAGQDDTVEE